MADPAIHLTKWGDSGPLVVMVHGSAQGSEVGGERHFSAQARLADRGWRLVVPDRPGHGRSPAPDRGDDAEADGEWVAELLGDGAHLVGHSFGGAVALAAAARRPEAVRSLTLIEPAMMPLAMSDPRVQAFGMQQREAMMAASSAGERAVRLTKLLGIPAAIRGGSSPEILERMGRGLARLVLPTEATLRAELATIAGAGIPLLVVSGGWNPAFEAVCDTVARLGGGRHVVVRSEHHFPQLASDEFNDVLVDFMTQADQRAAKPR